MYDQLVLIRKKIHCETISNHHHHAPQKAIETSMRGLLGTGPLAQFVRVQVV